MKSALRIISTLTVLGLAVPAFAAADAKPETTKTATKKTTTKKTSKKATTKKTDTKPQASEVK